MEINIQNFNMERQKDKRLACYIEILSLLDSGNTHAIEFKLLEDEMSLTQTSDDQSKSFTDIIHNHSKELKIDFSTLLDYVLEKVEKRGFSVREFHFSGGRLITIS